MCWKVFSLFHSAEEFEQSLEEGIFVFKFFVFIIVIINIILIPCFYCCDYNFLMTILLPFM